jgi:hypothetical protein
VWLHHDTAMVFRFNVRFGSKADIRAAKSDVRFTPESDRESGFPRKVMSALSPKADMCSALAHVCFGPKAESVAISAVPGAAQLRARGHLTMNQISHHSRPSFDQRAAQ